MKKILILASVLCSFSMGAQANENKYHKQNKDGYERNHTTRTERMKEHGYGGHLNNQYWADYKCDKDANSYLGRNIGSRGRGHENNQ